MEQGFYLKILLQKDFEIENIDKFIDMLEKWGYTFGGCFRDKHAEGVIENSIHEITTEKDRKVIITICSMAFTGFLESIQISENVDVLSDEEHMILYRPAIYFR